jgi:crossover junction endodeoxyribonuclease RuvC
MRIIAIDPGYDRCGVAILEKLRGAKETVLFSMCIETDKKSSFNERLSFINNTCRELIENYAPESMALERLFFNTNQKTAMHVAEVRGMLIQLANEMVLTYAEYSPPQVKLAVGGSGKASKSDVARMIELLVVLPTRNTSAKRKDDELDAIAVGLTHLACMPQKRVHV